MTTTELRVFISSTFRDLQEEREHLVKKIFPEIRALCRSRGVTFTDIDLRWGITEEEAEKEGIIHICLDEIDRCRPYFIGILGERYGWTPPRSDAERIADRFPVLGSRLLDGASITEMEIMHGVLANPAMAGHAFFYFRDHGATPAESVDTDPDIAARLLDLKARIRQSGFPVRENFTSSAELGAWIEEDLRHVIDVVHPESETPSPLELERRSHRAFAASRTRAYVANPEYDRQFNEWITAEGRGTRAEGRGTETDPSSLDPHPSCLIPRPSSLNPLCITAESGLGKSSLLAHLVAEYRFSHTTAFVIEHYVGASQASGTATAIMRQVIEEIRERFGITDEAATTPDELERSFPNWLYRGEHFAKQEGIEMLIVIDAVNQLDEAGTRLAWIPTVMPPGIKFVVSTIPGPCADALEQREWARLGVRPIEDESVRRAIVLHYLGEFHKGITAHQVDRVTADAKAASPLFLRVVAEELRLHGEHETLGAAIDRYATAADLLEVFDRVLERLERDYGTATVRDVTSVIWASRSGLAEEELIAIAGLSRMDLSRLLFALDFHLVQRGGVLGFFHDYIRRAVEKRYLADARVRRERSEELAAYFEKSETTIRSTLELLHALESTGDRARLAKTAADIERFTQLWPGVERHDVLRVWSETDRGVVARAYRSSLEEWVRRTSPEPARYAEALWLIGDLFERIGAWTDAETTQQERLAVVRAKGDRPGESGVLVRLASLVLKLGRLEEAERLAREAEGIAREVGDRGVLGSAVGIRGNVYANHGEYEAALACCAEQESIARALGDSTSIRIAVGNRGIVHMDRGEYDAALACFAEQESIARGMGDRQHISLAVGNRGIVHRMRGEFEAAFACYAEKESIARGIGDRKASGIAVGNRGGAQLARGEHEAALACYEEALVEHQQIGFRYGVTYWLEGTSRALLELAERETDPPPYLARHVPEAVGVGWKSACLRHSRARAGECLAISRELHKPDTLHSSQVLFARIDAAEGRTESAIEKLRTMLAEAGNDTDRADLHYWLWKLGVAEHGAAARAHYEALYAKTPKYEYMERIDELVV